MSEEELKERAQRLLQQFDPGEVDQFTFRGAQYDAGLAWVSFPVGLGGLGIQRSGQSIVNETLREGGSPYHDLFINFIGIGMGAPTMLQFGSAEMMERHFRPIFTGEEIWCQLFSEPSSGSDVAGIPSRAVLDGNEWVVNGQKVWTTLAHVAKFAMLLVRTNPDVPKHAGLSYFIMEMNSPGVEVRPLFQMTGEAEFNEVFLTDVRIPAYNMVGGPGDGWRVATATLMNERVTLGGGSGGKGGGPIRSLMRTWNEHRDELPPHQFAVLRDKVSDLWIRAEVLRLTNQRSRDVAASGQPGPGGSVGKLMSGQLNQLIFSTCLDIQGTDSLIYPEGYPMVRTDSSRNGSVVRQFLRSRAGTIEGGTTEIQKNIIGERVLGLPGDLRVDKNIPWRDLER